MGARRNGQLPGILRRRSRASGMEHGKSEVSSVTSFRPKYLLKQKICEVIKLPGSYCVKVVHLIMKNVFDRK